MTKQFSSKDLKWAYKELAVSYDEVCASPLAIEHVREYHLFLQAQKLTYDLLFSGIDKATVKKSAKRVCRRHAKISQWKYWAYQDYSMFLDTVLDYIR